MVTLKGNPIIEPLKEPLKDPYLGKINPYGMLPSKPEVILPP